MEAFILSSWNHIMGPQIQKLWLMKDVGNAKLSEVSNDVLSDFNIFKSNKENLNSVINTFPDMKIYSIMCGQLLLGEVDSCKPLEDLASRFYISESKILIAIVYRLHEFITSTQVINRAKDVCLCFGIIFKRDKIDFALDNHQLIDLHLRKAVTLMQNSKVPFYLIVTKLFDIIEEFQLQLSSMAEVNLSHIQRPYYSSFQDFANSDFISKAIVSHLQTSGCTVIIGGSEFAINQIIQMLNLLCLSSDSHCSFVASQIVPTSFIQGIYNQSIIKCTSKERPVLLEKARRESFSITFIDVDICKVWQTLPIQDGRVSCKYRYVTCLVSQTGYLVPQLFKDLGFIQKCKADCQLFVQNFYKHLLEKSLCLIRTVENLSFCDRSVNLMDVMGFLAISEVADLQILLGCAEMLKPGFRIQFTVL